MSDNPRLTALMAARRNYPNWSAVKVLAAIDASDPLRQPPSDEALDAALEAAMVLTWGDADSQPVVRSHMRNVLLAALAVMRGEKPADAIDAFIDANPPPDAIEDRIAALEARPVWTAEKEALLQGLVAEVMPVTPHREFIREAVLAERREIERLRATLRDTIAAFDRAAISLDAAGDKLAASVSAVAIGNARKGLGDG